MRELGNSTNPVTRRSLTAIGLMGLAALILLTVAVPRSEAAFPGKNGLIAFDSNRAGSVDLFRMNKNGTGVVRITDSAADDSVFGPLDENPAWSPEGGTLAFDSSRGGASVDIWTVNLNGTGFMDLTPYSSVNDTDPAWSYNGRLIVFETDDGGDRDIALITSDGGQFRVLTPDPPFSEMEMNPAPPINDENPVFSMDSQRIFFQSDRNSPGAPQIFSMNLDGSGVTQLTSPPGQSRDPDISPDGTEVLFVSDRHSPAGPTDVYAMNLDGSNPRRVGSVAGDEFRPVFSPDALRVAFANLAPGQFQTDIFGMSVVGAGLGSLAPDPASDGNPDWQPARYSCQGEAPTVIGSYADESIVGTQKEDVIVALDGDDTIKALGGNDVVCSGLGNDIVNGGEGDDILKGGRQGDKLKGKAGADGLFGGAPRANSKRPDPDVCRGGRGRDNVKGCGNS